MSPSEPTAAEETELEQLRALVEEYRQRELEELRRRVAEAEHAAQHYRAEATRIERAGRELQAILQERINKLEAQLQARENVAIHGARFGSNRNPAD